MFTREGGGVSAEVRLLCCEVVFLRELRRLLTCSESTAVPNAFLNCPYEFSRVGSFGAVDSSLGPGAVTDSLLGGSEGVVLAAGLGVVTDFVGIEGLLEGGLSAGGGEIELLFKEALLRDGKAGGEPGVLILARFELSFVPFDDGGGPLSRSSALAPGIFPTLFGGGAKVLTSLTSIVAKYRVPTFSSSFLPTRGTFVNTILSSD